MTKSEVVFYSRTLDGHRASYLKFAQQLFNGRREGPWRTLVSAQPALFLMADEKFAHYFLTALTRAILGRRTVGLLFRPLPAVEGASAKQLFKNSLLRLLRLVAEVRTLSIVPTPLDSRVASLVDGWIYDFQLWDISPEERAMASAIKAGRSAVIEAQSLVDLIRAHLSGRRLLVAIGVQSKNKGFARFAELAATDLSLQWAFVSLGRVAAECADAREALATAGGLVIDRFVSDSELIAAYALADAVWCFYDEAYDQASGVLGRAVQFGLPVIVRKGSISHKFCVAENYPHIAAMATSDVASNLESGPELLEGMVTERVQRFRRLSIATLSQQLGIRCIDEANPISIEHGAPNHAP